LKSREALSYNVKKNFAQYLDMGRYFTYNKSEDTAQGRCLT